MNADTNSSDPISICCSESTRRIRDTNSTPTRAPAVNAPRTRPNHQVAAPSRRRPKANRKVVNPTRAFSTDMGIRARITSVSAMGRKAARSSSSPRHASSTSGASSIGDATATVGSGPARGPGPAEVLARRPVGHGQAQAGDHRGDEHPHVDPQHPRSPAQLEDGHRGQGEGEAGQRGQQPQPGVEGGQVRLDRRGAGARVVDPDERHAVGRRGIGRVAGSGQGGRRRRCRCRSWRVRRPVAGLVDRRPGVDASSSMPSAAISGTSAPLVTT